MDGNGFDIGPSAINAPVSSDVLLQKTADIYNFIIDVFGGQSGSLIRFVLDYVIESLLLELFGGLCYQSLIM